MKTTSTPPWYLSNRGTFSHQRCELYLLVLPAWTSASMMTLGATLSRKIQCWMQSPPTGPKAQVSHWRRAFVKVGWYLWPLGRKLDSSSQPRSPPRPCVGDFLFHRRNYSITTYLVRSSSPHSKRRLDSRAVHAGVRSIRHLLKRIGNIDLRPYLASDDGVAILNEPNWAFLWWVRDEVAFSFPLPGRASLLLGAILSRKRSPEIVYIAFVLKSVKRGSRCCFYNLDINFANLLYPGTECKKRLPMLSTHDPAPRGSMDVAHDIPRRLLAQPQRR